MRKILIVLALALALYGPLEQARDVVRAWGGTPRGADTTAQWIQIRLLR